MTTVDLDSAPYRRGASARASSIGQSVAHSNYVLLRARRLTINDVLCSPVGSALSVCGGLQRLQAIRTNSSEAVGDFVCALYWDRTVRIENAALRKFTTAHDGTAPLATQPAAAGS